MWYHDIGGDCGEVAGEGRPWRLRARPSWSLGVGLTRGGGLYSQLLVCVLYTSSHHSVVVVMVMIFFLAAAAVM